MNETLYAVDESGEVISQSGETFDEVSARYYKLIAWNLTSQEVNA